MTTLVTGASGFLGNHVVRLLAERGERIRVLLRPTSPTRLLEGLAVERVSGDLRDPASLDKAVAGVRIVYHLAADYRLWARDPREFGKRATRYQRAIEQKESFKWIKSFHAAARLQRRLTP